MSTEECSVVEKQLQSSKSKEICGFFVTLAHNLTLKENDIKGRLTISCNFFLFRQIKATKTLKGISVVAIT